MFIYLFIDLSIYIFIYLFVYMYIWCAVPGLSLLNSFCVTISFDGLVASETHDDMWDHVGFDKAKLGQGHHSFPVIHASLLGSPAIPDESPLTD
jgi:hypothetical protein